MDIRIVSYLTSQMVFCLGAVYFIPWGISMYLQDRCSDVFFTCVFICNLVGGLLHHYGRFNKFSQNISNREGIATATFSWILCAALSGMPYWMTGVLDLSSSFFEGMSAVTTNGVTAIDSLQVLPRSILFWRGITHWLGGLGIIVIFISLLPRMSGGAFHLFVAEATGFNEDRLLPRLRSTARILFIIYLSLTLVEAVLLFICGMDLFDAVNHAMATVATAGFSTHDSGILYYDNPLIELVIFFFMILAGANFALYYKAYHRGWRVLWGDEEFRYFLYFVFATSCVVSLSVFWGTEEGIWNSIRHGFFMVASFSSTTGFVSANYEQWPPIAKLALVLLYFTGGCAGSTAGGIKIARFVVLVRMTLVELKRVLHPKMLFSVKFEGKPLTIAVLAQISRFFFLYVISIVVLSILFAATGVSLTEAIFGVMACISSCGAAFGGIGLDGEFVHISSAGKMVLTLAMLLGRLEIYTVMVMLRKEFWRLNSRW